MTCRFPARNSDGYPASVLRDLVQLKDLLDATRAERGPAYTAATFVFLDKLSTVGLYLDGEPERTIDAAQPADLLEPSAGSSTPWPSRNSG